MSLFVVFVSFRFVFFLLAPKAQFGSGLIPTLAVLPPRCAFHDKGARP